MDDYAFAYQISSTNFDTIANSNLYRGNILRFKALSAEQIFVSYFDVNRQDKTFPIITYLIEACNTAKEQLEVYRAEIDGERVGYPNEYGIGLASFHLGYLYDKYSSHLGSTEVQAMHSEEFYQGKSELDFRILAMKYFTEAYKSFSEMNHLKGMYLAKEHEASLCEMLYKTLDDFDLMHSRARKLA